MPHVPSLTTQDRRWRTGFLIACVLIGTVMIYGCLEGTPLAPWASTTMGMSPEYDRHAAAAIVTSVDRNGPAYDAGIRAGDRLDLAAVPFKERWRIRDVVKGYGGVAGERLRYLVWRGTRPFYATIVPRDVPPAWPRGFDIMAWSIDFWALGLAALLAIKRPDLREARLLALIIIFLYGVNSLTGFFIEWPPAEFIMTLCTDATYMVVPMVCLTLLAGCFAVPLAPWRKRLAVAGYAGAVPWFLSSVGFTVLGLLFALPVFGLYYEWVSGLGALLSLACIVAAAFVSAGAERARATLIAISIAPVWLWYSFISLIVSTLNAHLYFTQDLNAPLYAAVAVMPAVLTYAVLARRIIDIGYVVNRALIFGGISLLVFAVFAVVEWALEAQASNVSHNTGTLINVTVALVLGFSIRFLHRRIERFVDWLFFRKRHENESELRRFAHEAAYITDVSTLIARLREIVLRCGECSSVAIFLDAGDGNYESGEGCRVSENDPVIVSVRARHEPIDLHGYDTSLDGELVFPMSARGHVAGILVCGEKRGGEAYAPDERDALRAAADGTGAALGALRLSGQSDLAAIQAELQRLSDAIASHAEVRAELQEIKEAIASRLHVTSERL